MSPSLTTQDLILSATEGLCLKYHNRVRRMSFFKFIIIFCGSHSYLIVAQCSDGAWIPTPAHQGNPISILGFTHKHLTGGISAQTTATLSFHKLVFSHKNVSGNGSSLAGMVPTELDPLITAE